MTGEERAALFADRARRYAELGYALVRVNGKRPLDKDWEATKPGEPGYVAGQWAHHGRRHNIGGVCGPSGLAILDVDHENADDAYRDRFGELPRTPTVRTGSGRLQVYFADPGGLTKTVRDGIELRVGPHMCVLPPSVHPDTGATYEWELDPWTVPLLELPAEVLEYFAETNRAGRLAAPVAEKIPYGQQHYELVSLAGTMRRRGLTADEIFAALWQVNLNRCEIPGPEKHVRQIAESVALYEPSPDGRHIKRDDDLPEFVPELPKVALPARWQLRSLSESVPRLTRWLVPGLIPLRFLTLVAGIGGLGKTTWLLGLAAAGSVAEEPWETIYVSFEDTADEVLRPRIEAAGGNPARVHELVLTDTEALDSFSLPRDVENLQALIRERTARLVVIDPVVAAVEAKLDAYKDQHVRQVLAQLFRMSREEDCAVAMVGHLNRVPSTDAYLRISNSTAFWNAARSVVLITEDGGDGSDLRLIAQRKANLARLAPIQRHRLEEIVLPETVDPETGKPIVTSRMRFVETADDVNASEILGPQTLTKTETAESLLEVLLGDGEWRESRAVQRVLEAAGFNERLARRAAKDLDVEYERRGFPSVTWWRLPVGTDPVGTTTRSEDVLTGEIAQPGRLEPASAPVRTSFWRAASDSLTETAPRPLIGDPAYWRFLVSALEADAITREESDEQYELHRLVSRARYDIGEEPPA